MHDFDAYATQELATRTVSKTLNTHDTKLEASNDEIMDIKYLMAQAFKKRVVASHAYSPYKDLTPSPTFPQDPGPHPPYSPKPPAVIPSGNPASVRKCASIQRPQVRKIGAIGM